MTTQPLNVEPRRETNRLLAALPSADYARLAVHLELVPLTLRAVLWQPNEDIEYAYFPQSGCLSMVSVMHDGNTVEVGTVGFEGMAPMSFLNGVNWLSARCIVQITGEANRIERSLLQTALRTDQSLADLLHRYAEVWISQIGWSATCNAVHTIEERCARWLLMTQDRVRSDVLPLTQEFLSVMLGVRRASVTVAAGLLHKAGLIRYARGRITILDRAGLEGASCGCYREMEESYSRLLFPGLHLDAPTLKPGMSIGVVPR